MTMMTSRSAKMCQPWTPGLPFVKDGLGVGVASDLSDKGSL